MLRLAHERGLTLIHRVRELRPEEQPLPAPPPPEKLAEGLKRLGDAAAQAGVPFLWNSHRVYSRLALEGGKFAAAHGKQDEYDDLLFKAQYVDNRDISDVDFLATVAGQLGLDSAAFRQCLAERRYRDQIIAETAEFHKLGLSGIPHYLPVGQPGPGVHTVEELAARLDA